MSMVIDTSELHPSTQLGLYALKWLGPQRSCDHILDMGCGSGVLSITAAHLWPATVLAADISPNAIRDAQKAVADYDLDDRISVVRSDRFANTAIRQHAPYDLIIANLLDQWLIEIASDIKDHLTPDGVILLSGMLDWMAAGTLHAYDLLGFEIKQEFSSSPWRAVILGSKP